MISKPHVLAIEDNEDILSMLDDMLTLEGYSVTTKKDANDLEALIKVVSPDIILMDMLLSGVDGRDICKDLKSKDEFSAIPIIMLSAHPEAKEICLKAGADYFLSKPFDMEDLFEAVEKAGMNA
jgi:DNA-binding response OmpR family regulator